MQLTRVGTFTATASAGADQATCTTEHHPSVGTRWVRLQTSCTFADSSRTAALLNHQSPSTLSRAVPPAGQALLCAPLTSGGSITPAQPASSLPPSKTCPLPIPVSSTHFLCLCNHCLSPACPNHPSQALHLLTVHLSAQGPRTACPAFWQHNRSFAWLTVFIFSTGAPLSLSALLRFSFSYAPQPLTP